MQDVKNEVNQDLTRKENQLAVFLKPLEKYYGAILIAAGIVLAFYGNKFLTFVTVGGDDDEACADFLACPPVRHPHLILPRTDL